VAEREEQERGITGHLVRGLGSSTRQNALAYGYSLALTGAFGMLTAVDRSPHVVDIFLFALGGASTFTVANVVVTRGFKIRVAEEPPVVLALGTSLGFFSIAGALGVTALLAWTLHGWLAWLVGPFAASAVYLALTAVELTLARKVREVVGIERLEER
jgi:hypothetical protein